MCLFVNLCQVRVYLRVKNGVYTYVNRSKKVTIFNFFGKLIIGEQDDEYISRHNRYFYEFWYS